MRKTRVLIYPQISVGGDARSKPVIEAFLTRLKAKKDRGEAITADEVNLLKQLALARQRQSNAGTVFA
jgi:hypothetical protein